MINTNKIYSISLIASNNMEKITNNMKMLKNILMNLPMLKPLTLEILTNSNILKIITAGPENFERKYELFFKNSVSYYYIII